ncbi:MAG: hypothetical protein K0S07_653 [Chlamydiales bacterium]|jgi:hypothetical protein|nr:hypothetical protein [Chlamydiales bacterium]
MGTVIPNTIAAVMEQNPTGTYYKSAADRSTRTQNIWYLPPHALYSSAANFIGKVIRVALEVFCVASAVCVAQTIRQTCGILAVRPFIYYGAIAGLVSGLAYGLFTDMRNLTIFDQIKLKGERWACYKAAVKILDPVVKFGAVAAVTAYARRIFSMGAVLPSQPYILGAISFGICFRIGSTVSRSIRRVAEGVPAVLNLNALNTLAQLNPVEPVLTGPA